MLLLYIITIRYATGTKLLLNAWLDRSLTVSKQSDKMVQLVCVNHAEVPLPAPAGATVAATSKIGTYLIKTKTADVRHVYIYCLLYAILYIFYYYSMYVLLYYSIVTDCVSPNVRVSAGGGGHLRHRIGLHRES